MRRRKVQKMQMPSGDFIVRWKKTDEHLRQRFERAVKRSGGTRASVARALFVAYSDIVLSRDRGDIDRAAERAAKE